MTHIYSETAMYNVQQNLTMLLLAELHGGKLITYAVTSEFHAMHCPIPSYKCGILAL